MFSFIVANSSINFLFFRIIFFDSFVILMRSSKVVLIEPTVL